MPSYAWDTAANLWLPCTAGVSFKTVANHYIRQASASTFSYEWSQPFTLSAWAKPNAGGGGYIISKFTIASLFFGYGIAFDVDSYVFWVVSDLLGARIRCTGTYTDRDAWNHVVAVNAGTGNAADNRIYVDGEVSSATITENDLGDSIVNDVPLNIGARTNGEAPYGNFVAHAAIWDIAMNATQVTELYASGTRPDLTTLSTAGNLQLWHKLDDATTSSAPDSSGNGLHGVCVGITSDYLSLTGI